MVVKRLFFRAVLSGSGAKPEKKMPRMLSTRQS